MTVPLQNLDIDSLVRRVMADLREKSHGKTQSEAQQPASSSASNREKEVAQPQMVEELQLSERLISLSTISQYDKGTNHQWRVSRRVVITPSAREELKRRGITLLFDEMATSGSNQTTGNASVFVVNHLPTDEKLPPVLAKLFQSYQATIVSQACLIKTTGQLAETIATSPTTTAVVLTHYPGLASSLANHREGLRAITGHSLDVLKREAPLLGPNVLIIDPAQTLLWHSTEILRWFLDRSPWTPASFLEDSL